MNHIPLDFLREAINPHIRGCSTRIIKSDATPHLICRVTLRYDDGVPGVRSVIMKYTDPDWPHDPYASIREGSFYRELLPRTSLRTPKIYYNGRDPESQRQLMVLEDLEPDYYFPEPAHCWSEVEVRCLLRAYARLHSDGEAVLAKHQPETWMFSYHTPTWQPENLLRMVQDLVIKGIWAPIPGLNRLVDRTLRALSSWDRSQLTLLHHDACPPNVALPVNLDGEAILIDWELGGWGIAELDLAYLYLQPFRSASRIDRDCALAYYWDLREELDASGTPPLDRPAIQQDADALLALSLVPVAHRVAARPFPPGSGPHAYWEAMFGGLHGWLASLAQR